MLRLPSRLRASLVPESWSYLPNSPELTSKANTGLLLWAAFLGWATAPVCILLEPRSGYGASLLGRRLKHGCVGRGVCVSTITCLRTQQVGGKKMGSALVRADLL